MTKSILSMLMLFSLMSCNSLSGIKVPDNYAENLPESSKIDIPHILQRDRYSCATTSLAMVISYYDKTNYSKIDFWEASKSRINDVRSYGNDMAGLKRAAEHYGYTKYDLMMVFNKEKIKFLISEGIPVIVNIRNFFKNSYHAVVVNGYDKDGFFITDPASSYEYKKSYEKFNAHWYANLSSPKGKHKKTAFIVYPKQ